MLELVLFLILLIAVPTVALFRSADSTKHDRPNWW